MALLCFQSASCYSQVDARYHVVLRTGMCGLHVPPHWQYQALQVPSRAQSKHTVNISSVRSNFFGIRQQFHRPQKRCTGLYTISSNVDISGALDTQDSYWEREGACWLREEQRWLREEQRWLREEARWNAERKALVEQSVTLMDEISVLKQEIVRLQIQAKEENTKDTVLPDLIVSLSSLLQSLKNAGTTESGTPKTSVTQAQIPSAPSASTNFSGAFKDVLSQSPAENFKVAIPVDLVAAVSSNITESTEEPGAGIGKSKTKPFVSKEGSLSNEQATTASKGPSVTGRNKRTLKMGAEGEDVREMQEALARLGFYSGEDDMEYSSFSSGTDSAVKSWQATIGKKEDGIVTTELLVTLFGEGTPSSSEKLKATGTSVSSTPPQAGVKAQGSASPGAGVIAKQVTEVREAIKGTSRGKEVSQTRVYLLGENRWEDPDRLLSRNGPSPGAVNVVVGEKCFSCRGEGTTLCTECEGTGELNVEDQFLEWVEEGAKCPYCEGTGVINCDVCDGKGVRTPS